METRSKKPIDVTIRCLALEFGQAVVLSKERNKHTFILDSRETAGRPCCLIVQVEGTAASGLDLVGLLSPPHSKEFRMHVPQGKRSKTEILIRVVFEPAPLRRPSEHQPHPAPFTPTHVAPAPYPATPERPNSPRAAPPSGYNVPRTVMQKRPAGGPISCGPFSCLGPIGPSSPADGLPEPLPHAAGDSQLELLQANCSRMLFQCTRG
eukprot:tig00020614_g12184.t1